MPDALDRVLEEILSTTSNPNERVLNEFIIPRQLMGSGNFYENPTTPQINKLARQAIKQEGYIRGTAIWWNDDEVIYTDEDMTHETLLTKSGKDNVLGNGFTG